MKIERACLLLSLAVSSLTLAAPEVAYRQDFESCRPGEMAIAAQGIMTNCCIGVSDFVACSGTKSLFVNPAWYDGVRDGWNWTIPGLARKIILPARGVIVFAYCFYVDEPKTAGVSVGFNLGFSGNPESQVHSHGGGISLRPRKDPKNQAQPDRLFPVGCGMGQWEAFRWNRVTVRIPTAGNLSEPVGVTLEELQADGRTWRKIGAGKCPLEKYAPPRDGAMVVEGQGRATWGGGYRVFYDDIVVSTESADNNRPGISPDFDSNELTLD